jgi:hypothetical protein
MTLELGFVTDRNPDLLDGHEFARARRTALVPGS